MKKRVSEDGSDGMDQARVSEGERFLCLLVQNSVAEGSRVRYLISSLGPRTRFITHITLNLLLRVGCIFS